MGETSIGVATAPGKAKFDSGKAGRERRSDGGAGVVVDGAIVALAVTSGTTQVGTGPILKLNPFLVTVVLLTVGADLTAPGGVDFTAVAPMTTPQGKSKRAQQIRAKLIVQDL